MSEQYVKMSDVMKEWPKKEHADWCPANKNLPCHCSVESLGSSHGINACQSALDKAHKVKVLSRDELIHVLNEAHYHIINPMLADKILKAMEVEDITVVKTSREQKLESALKELLTAVCFSHTKNFGTKDNPCICWEARVPVGFVDNARDVLREVEDAHKNS